MMTLGHAHQDVPGFVICVDAAGVSGSLVVSEMGISL